MDHMRRFQKVLFIEPETNKNLNYSLDFDVQEKLFITDKIKQKYS